MPRRSEVDRFKRFQTAGYDDFTGVYQGSESVLRSWKMNPKFYEAGLQYAEMPAGTTDPRHLKDALDLIKGQIESIRVGNLSLRKIEIDEEPDNWSMDNMDGSLSGEFFAPLESLVVFEILFRGVDAYQKKCRLENCFSEGPDLNKNAKLGSNLHSSNRKLLDFIATVDPLLQEVRRLLDEKRDSLFAAYQKAVEFYQDEEDSRSVLSVAWHGWMYPQGLPEGHAVFVTIDKFKQLFCKNVATE